MFSILCQNEEEEDVSPKDAGEPKEVELRHRKDSGIDNPGTLQQRMCSTGK